MPPTPASDILIPDFSLSGEKPLPVPPDEDSPLTSPTATISPGADASETSTVSTLLTATGPVITKREHALKELLSSERAYASDLAFIRNVHIPMALGKSAPFHLPRPATPPRSSGSSSRTLSTSSDSSFTSHNGPPMTKDDVRVIFSNITELAVFSDMFSDRLQEALGDVLEDGKGEDWIPQLEPPYKTYITKHPSALKHLSSLPQTPALASYLAHTQSLASSVTHAWDLPSLLIKPVQRLLKYSLLLSTIIEQTPDGHGDKDNLKKARDRMEEVARGVNEGRRRMEVVKDVLTGKTDTGKSVTLQKKMSIGKSAQVSVGRMKSMGMGMRAVRPKEEDNEESTRVAQHERQLRKCDAFVRGFAKDIVGWAQTVRTSQAHLRAWAVDFGKTIGINDEQPSEAFNAFLDVIDMRLMPLCQELDEVVAKELLPELAGLLDTSKAPTRLLTAMRSLEPLHYSLLNLNYSRHRPPPTMLEASQNYLALRGQLASDLPKYLELLDKGIVMCIRQFARRQTDFWSSVRDQWGTLWDCLRMEGETNAGCEETLKLWWNRYSEVDDAISKLTLLKRDKPPLKHHRSRPSGSVYQLSDIPSMESHLAHMTPLPNSPSSFSDSSSRHRSFGSLDSAPSRNVRRSPSSESVPSLSLSQLGKSRPRTPESMGRSKARANTFPSPASSSSATLNLFGVSSTSSLSRTSREYADSIDSRSDGRGYKSQSRGSSLTRKLSETLRAPLRRSPSQKSVASQRSQRSCTHSNGYGHFSTLNTSNSSAPPLPHHADYIDITPPLNSPTLYYVTAVHNCSPPDGAIYMDLPFLELQIGDIFGVLSELGHPSKHEGLCMDVDEGDEDCLLVVKDEGGEVGLALASFLVPFS
ncbi:hypothetical protein DFH11DRAFT_1803816 [Phellopilus nigrolimitatus]|nr:hypothetical protein DFH11DRAFT_1803816 [Phellopilus nigrolimitatus]